MINFLIDTSSSNPISRCAPSRRSYVTCGACVVRASGRHAGKRRDVARALENRAGFRQS